MRQASDSNEFEVHRPGVPSAQALDFFAVDLWQLGAIGLWALTGHEPRRRSGPQMGRRAFLRFLSIILSGGLKQVAEFIVYCLFGEDDGCLAARRWWETILTLGVPRIMLNVFCVPLVLSWSVDAGKRL